MNRELRRNTTVTVDPQYHDMIVKLHDDKVEINRVKIKNHGSIDIDDHGFIDFPDFKFTPDVCADGKVHGCRLIGRNFKRFLTEEPRYINRDSALAGCWIGGLGNWIPFGLIQEDIPEHATAIFKKYQILQPGFGAMNHLCPDLTIGLDLGWKGLLDKVRFYRELNDPADTDYYDGEELLLEGVIDWVAAHADLAESLAEKETDPFHKANYHEIARINRKLTHEAPETFREACQFIAHFQSIDRMYYAGGALGSLDRVLRPYYYRDMESGILNDSMAVWMIASVLFNDTHYSQINGLTPDGTRETADHLSFVILEAMHQLKIPANIAVRVHENLGPDDLSEALIVKSLENTLEDGTGPDYSLETGITKGYVRNGHSEPLGRLKVKSGCNWCAIEGREYPLEDVTRINMPMAMQFAMEDLKAEDEPSTEKLWELFVKHLTVMVDAIKEGFDRHYEIMQRNRPEIVLNLFMDGPIERGVNSSCGGVDIISMCIDGIGLATVADSFAAIEQRVEQEGRITWERLYELLDTDYENAERERLMLKNIKRFGNPESPAEKWAIRTRDLFVGLCKGSNTPIHGLQTIPGLFSHGDVYMYGKTLGASANGRHAKDPISHNSEPDPGFAKGVDSFSYVLKSEAVIRTQPGYGNSAPLQLDIDTGLLKKTGGIDALKSLIYTHEKEGGTLINMNCLSREQLLAAHEDPEAFPELVVRVTGYSAFFASLSPMYRQQVVDRFLAE